MGLLFGGILVHCWFEAVVTAGFRASSLLFGLDLREVGGGFLSAASIYGGK